MGAVVENVSSYTSTSPYVFIVLCLIKYGNIFMISPFPLDTFQLFGLRSKETAELANQ
jgi:hypothetical protein